tara:strand:- start:168 stop:2411 length:2244 start_codon:yes stop_codon:yes gene_type:complete
MSRIFFPVVKIWVFTSFTFGKDIYQSIRLYDPSPSNIAIVASQGIPLDHIGGKRGVYVDLTCTKNQATNLLSKGLTLDILVLDLTSFYKERNRPAISRNFPLGSMQGNYTWNELNNRFDELLNLYSNIISERLVIGESVEGRDIWAFKISDNPNIDEDEPEVLYTSLIHSREPLSMMSLFYFAQKLAEGYNVDDELTYLVNNREMWFVPVVNPDGYVFNEEIEPFGGGMHRKNRKNTNCGNGTGRGIDLNRNFGYGWGADNIGSSSDPCSEVYRGDSPFSEPETEAVRDFILNHDFKNVLHYHSYSNLYIHAFGDGSYPEEPDLTTHSEIGLEMARHNGYYVGTGLDGIGYTVNGDAVDWSYGDQGLIAYVPEVGSYSQGFWPSEDEVEQLCIDQLHPNKIFSFVAGSDIIVHSFEISEEFLLPAAEADIEILIQNRGLTNSASDIEISFTPLNNWIYFDDEPFIMSEIDARDADDVTLTFTVSPNASPGVSSGIIVNITSENSYPRSQVINFVIGEPQIISNDNFENGLDDWDVSGDWGLSSDVFSGLYALSDSPDGDYQDGQETFAEYIREVDLQFISNPVIKFNAKWDIESSYDFVRFQAMISDSGWVSLSGQYTETGSGQPAQAFGDHGYDGLQEDWVEETIYLDHLDESQITGFRFIQTSDNFVEGDGFSLDNFQILGYPTGLIGDFNSDAGVDIFDILGLADLLLFGDDPSQAQLFFCDLDSNGMLDIMDLLRLSNIILGL